MLLRLLDSIKDITIFFKKKLAIANENEYHYH